MREAAMSRCRRIRSDARKAQALTLRLQAGEATGGRGEGVQSKAANEAFFHRWQREGGIRLRTRITVRRRLARTCDESRRSSAVASGVGVQVDDEEAHFNIVDVFRLRSNTRGARRRRASRYPKFNAAIIAQTSDANSRAGTKYL